MRTVPCVFLYLSTQKISVDPPISRTVTQMHTVMITEEPTDEENRLNMEIICRNIQSTFRKKNTLLKIYSTHTHIHTHTHTQTNTVMPVGTPCVLLVCNRAPIL